MEPHGQLSEHVCMCAGGGVNAAPEGHSGSRLLKQNPHNFIPGHVGMCACAGAGLRQRATVALGYAAAAALPWGTGQSEGGLHPLQSLLFYII